MLRKVLLFALALFVLQPTLRGQAPVPVVDFDELKACLTVGKYVIVTDDGGHIVQGKLADLTASSLVLKGGDERKTVPVAAVRLVEKWEGDPLWDGALKGFVAGFPLAIAFLHGNPDSPLSNLGGYLAGWTIGIGVAAGVIADAVVERKVVIYRARMATSRASFVVTPILTAGSQGLSVSFSF
jgi:hypothetical protein